MLGRGSTPQRCNDEHLEQMIIVFADQVPAEPSGLGIWDFLELAGPVQKQASSVFVVAAKPRLALATYDILVVHADGRFLGVDPFRVGNETKRRQIRVDLIEASGNDMRLDERGYVFLTELAHRHFLRPRSPYHPPRDA